MPARTDMRQFFAGWGELIIERLEKLSDSG
jgi:hypothetical protein